jgi:hypothetical protein
VSIRQRNGGDAEMRALEAGLARQRYGGVAGMNRISANTG